MMGLVFGSIATMVQAGFIMGVGLLLDTFLVRTLLVPSTVVLLGRWNWWPSKLSVDSPSPDPVSASADALGLSTSTDRPEGPAGAADADSESRRNS